MTRRPRGAIRRSARWYGWGTFCFELTWEKAYLIPAWMLSIIIAKALHFDGKSNPWSYAGFKRANRPKWNSNQQSQDGCFKPFKLLATQRKFVNQQVAHYSLQAQRQRINFNNCLIKQVCKILADRIHILLPENPTSQIKCPSRWNSRRRSN